MASTSGNRDLARIRRPERLAGQPDDRFRQANRRSVTLLLEHLPH